MSGPSDAIQIAATMSGAAMVVSVQGEVDLHTAPQLRTQVLEWTRRLQGPLLLELSGVSYMDSSGVGTIVFFKREVERAGYRLVLVGPGPRVRSVLEITHLDRFFTIAGSLDEVGGS